MSDKKSVASLPSKYCKKHFLDWTFWPEWDRTLAQIVGIGPGGWIERLQEGVFRIKYEGITTNQE